MKIPIWLQLITGLMLGWIVFLIYITPAVIEGDPWYKIAGHFLTIGALWFLRKDFHRHYNS